MIYEKIYNGEQKIYNINVLTNEIFSPNNKYGDFDKLKKVRTYSHKLYTQINKDHGYDFITSYINPYEYITKSSHILYFTRKDPSKKKSIKLMRHTNNLFFIYKQNKLFLPVPLIENMDAHYYYNIELYTKFNEILDLQNTDRKNVLVFDNISKFDVYDDILQYPTGIVHSYLDYKNVIIKNYTKDNVYAIYINSDKIKFTKEIDGIQRSMINNYNHILINNIHKYNINEIQNYPKMDLIIIGKTKKYQGELFISRVFLYEKIQLINMCICLLKLAKNGDCVIEIGCPLNKPTYQMLYLYSSYFDNIYLYRPKIYHQRAEKIYIVCKNFKGLDNANKIHDLLNKLLDLKKTKETHKFMVDDNLHEEYIKQDFPLNIIDFKEPIPQKFIDQLKSVSDKVIDDQMKTFVKINKFYDNFIQVDYNVKEEFLNGRTQEQINLAKEWCKDMNFPIKDIYKEEERIGAENFIEMNDRIKRLIFPKNIGKKKNIDYNKILMTDVGQYSVTGYRESDRISDIISSYFKKDRNSIVITDGTSGIGGNTLSFCKYFKHVNAVEYSPVHCKVLMNNLIKVYEIENVTIMCNDYTKIFAKLEQDVVFLDPPWGGSAYKTVPRIYLYLGKHDVVDILNKLKNKTKLVLLKVPYNYDITHLVNESEFDKYKVIKFRKFLLIVLS